MSFLAQLCRFYSLQWFWECVYSSRWSRILRECSLCSVAVAFVPFFTQGHHSLCLHVWMNPSFYGAKRLPLPQQRRSSLSRSASWLFISKDCTRGCVCRPSIYINLWFYIHKSRLFSWANLFTTEGQAHDVMNRLQRGSLTKAILGLLEEGGQDNQVNSFQGPIPHPHQTWLAQNQ
jgi:hypothetical protein